MTETKTIDTDALREAWDKWSIGDHVSSDDLALLRQGLFVYSALHKIFGDALVFRGAIAEQIRIETILDQR